MTSPACPCGARDEAGRPVAYRDCCRPLHEGERRAGTPEQLMRSRYAAFVVGDLGYLTRTWHPRTRPRDLMLPPVRWTGLQVLEATGEEVEFVATYVERGRTGHLHERSTFARRAGRWLYLEGTVAG